MAGRRLVRLSAAWRLRPTPGANRRSFVVAKRYDSSGLTTVPCCVDIRQPFGPSPPLNSHLVATTRETLADYNVRLVLVDRSLSESGAG